MISKRIKDLENNRTYSIDFSQRSLGEGATARVWKGVSQNDTQEVAIKIAYQNTSPSDLEKFQAEVELVQALQKKAGNHGYVPWMHRGQDLDNKNDHIIVMQLVPETWELGRQVSHCHSPQQAEKLLLRAGMDYARLLENLHSRNYFTKGDRKGTDLRWHPDEEHLIVLDWNRAGQVVDEMNKQQDIRAFGRLWFEFLVGFGNTPTIDTQDTFSYGFLQILEKAKESSSLSGYPDATALYTDLENHHNRWKQSSSHLWNKIEVLYNKNKDSNVLSEQIKAAEEIKILFDLIQNIPQDTISPPIPSSRREEIKDWSERVATHITTEVNQLLKQIQRKLTQGSYEEAKQNLKDAQKKYASDEQIESLQAALQVSRWYIIASIAWQAQQDKKLTGEIVSGLIDFVTNLENLANIPITDNAPPPSLTQISQSTQVSFRKITSNDLIQRYENIFDPLRLEFNIYTYIIKGLRSRDEQESQNDYQVAYETWQKLHALNQMYADFMRITFPFLKQLLIEREDKTIRQASLAEKKAEFEQKWQELKTSLNTPALDTGWIDLSESIGAVRVAYREERDALTGYETGSSQDIHRQIYDEFVSKLDILNRLMSEQADIIKGLKFIKEWPTPVSFNVDREIAEIKQRCQIHARQRAKQISQKRGWPEELEMAQEIVKLLSGPSFGGIAELRNLSWEVDKWAKKLKIFREKLGEITPTQLANDLDISFADDLLAEALAEKIEIYNRANLSEEEISYRQVAYLQAMREANRLSHQFSQLHQKLIDTVETLQQRVGTVQQNVDDLQDPLEQASGTVRQFTELSNQLVGWNTKLEEIDQKIREFGATYKKLEKIEPTLDSAQKKYQALQDKLQNVPKEEVLDNNINQLVGWNTKLEEIDQKIREFEATYKKLEKIEPILDSAQEIYQAIQDILKKEDLDNIIRELNNYIVKIEPAKEKLDSLLQQYNDTKNQAQVVWTSLAATWIQAGLQAIRQYDLKAADNARKQASSSWLNLPSNLLKPLDDAIEWLKLLRANDKLNSAFQHWTYWVEKAQASEAQAAYRSLINESQNYPLDLWQKLWSGWRGRELLSLHSELVKAIPSTDSKALISSTSYYFNKLDQLIQNDDVSSEEWAETTHLLEKQPLSMDEQKRMQNYYQYQQLHQLYNKVQGSQLPLPQTYNRLDQIVEQIIASLNTAPVAVSHTFWQQKHSLLDRMMTSLQDNFDRQDTNTLEQASRLYKFGLLIRQVRPSVNSYSPAGERSRS